MTGQHLVEVAMALDADDPTDAVERFLAAAADPARLMQFTITTYHDGAPQARYWMRREAGEVRGAGR